MSASSRPPRAFRLVAGTVALLVVLAVSSCSSDKSDGSKDSGSKKTKTTTTTTAVTTTTAGDPDDPDDIGTDKGANGDGGATKDSGKRGGSETEDGQKYVLAVQTQLVGSTFHVDETEARCVAPKWVDAIGVETLKRERVTTVDLANPTYQFSILKLSKAQADDMIGALGGCGVDVQEQLTDQMGEGLAKEKQTCIKQNLDLATVQAMLSATMRNGAPDPDGPIATKLDELSTTCKLREQPTG